MTCLVLNLEHIWALGIVAEKGEMNGMQPGRLQVQIDIFPVSDSTHRWRQRCQCVLSICA